MCVPCPDEPGRHPLEAFIEADQPLGEVIQAPGPGEVEAVQVDQLPVSPVDNLVTREKLRNIVCLTCTHLSRFQLEILIEKLWQEFSDPVKELVVLIHHLDHEVHLLQARGQEVRATGLVIEWTGSGNIFFTF